MDKKGKIERKKKENKIFSHSFGSGRERVRGERKVFPSLYDLRRSGGRNPSNQDLKFIYSMRATCGYRKQAISSKISCLEKKI